MADRVLSDKTAQAAETWRRGFYEAMRERHSVRATSPFSLKLVHLSQPSLQKKEKHAQPPAL